MSTTSTSIDIALERIASVIAEQRLVTEKLITNASNASAALAALPSEHSAVIAAIGDLPGGSALEDLQKDRLAKYTAEFQALKAVTDDIASKVV